MSPKKYRTFHNKCEKCICNVNLVVHHLDENRKNNTPENFIVLCRTCHAQIHNTIKNINKMKWLYDTNPNQLVFDFYENIDK